MYCIPTLNPQARRKQTLPYETAKNRHIFTMCIFRQFLANLQATLRYLESILNLVLRKIYIATFIFLCNFAMPLQNYIKYQPTQTAPYRQFARNSRSTKCLIREDCEQMATHRL